MLLPAYVVLPPVDGRGVAAFFPTLLVEGEMQQHDIRSSVVQSGSRWLRTGERRLGALEEAVLRELAACEGRPLSPRVIAQRLWGDGSVRAGRRVAGIVVRLRRKLNPGAIETIGGEGYRLVPTRPP